VLVCSSIGNRLTSVWPAAAIRRSSARSPRGPGVAGAASASTRIRPAVALALGSAGAAPAAGPQKALKQTSHPSDSASHVARTVAEEPHSSRRKCSLRVAARPPVSPTLANHEMARTGSVLAVACAPAPEGLQSAADRAWPEGVLRRLPRPLPEIPSEDFATRFGRPLADAAPGQRVDSKWADPLGESDPRRARQAQRLGRSRRYRLVLRAAETARHRRPAQSPPDTADDVLYVFDITESSPRVLPASAARPGPGPLPPRRPTPAPTTRTSRTARSSNAVSSRKKRTSITTGSSTRAKTPHGRAAGPPQHDRRRPPPFEGDRLYEPRRPTPDASRSTRCAKRPPTRWCSPPLVGLTAPAPCAPRSPSSTTWRRPGRYPAQECLARANLKLEDVGFTWSVTTSR